MLKMAGSIVFVVQYPANYEQQETDRDQIGDGFIFEEIGNLYLVKPGSAV